MLLDPLQWWAGTLGFLQARPLLLLILVFTLDSMGIPSVPELTTLLVFSLNPTPLWGVTVVLVCVVVEVSVGFGIFSLVHRYGIPHVLHRLMGHYSDSLLISDERLLLLNRVLPVLPMAAAFIHVRGWNPRKAFAYVGLGSAVKYGVIVAFSSVAYSFVDTRFARLVTVGALLVFLAISWSIAWYERRKVHRDREREERLEAELEAELVAAERHAGGSEDEDEVGEA